MHQSGKHDDTTCRMRNAFPASDQALFSQWGGPGILPGPTAFVSLFHRGAVVSFSAPAAIAEPYRPRRPAPQSVTLFHNFIVSRAHRLTHCRRSAGGFFAVRHEARTLQRTRCFRGRDDLSGCPRMQPIPRIDGGGSMKLLVTVTAGLMAAAIVGAAAPSVGDRRVGRSRGEGPSERERIDRRPWSIRRRRVGRGDQRWHDRRVRRRQPGCRSYLPRPGPRQRRDWRRPTLGGAAAARLARVPRRAASIGSCRVDLESSGRHAVVALAVRRCRHVIQPRHRAAWRRGGRQPRMGVDGH